MVEYPPIHRVYPHLVMLCEGGDIPKRLHILRFIQWLGLHLGLPRGTSSTSLRSRKRSKSNTFKAALYLSRYFRPALNIPRSRVTYSLLLYHTTYKWCHLQGRYRSYDRSIPLLEASAHIVPSYPRSYESARVARSSSTRNILVYSSLHHPIWKLKAFLATLLLGFSRVLRIRKRPIKCLFLFQGI